MNASTYEIEWKGRVIGAFSLPELRAKLDAGQLSRIHRVKAQGAWQQLGIWLDQMDADQHPSPLQARQQIQNDFALELEAERARNAILESRLQQLEQNLSRSPSGSPVSSTLGETPSPSFVLPETCGLAVASLVLGIVAALLFLASLVLSYKQEVPWFNVTFPACIVAWLLAVIFGHLAGAEIRRVPSLRGRNLALTGLLLGYAVVVLIGLCFVLAAIQDDYRNRFRF